MAVQFFLERVDDDFLMQGGFAILLQFLTHFKVFLGQKLLIEKDFFIQHFVMSFPFVVLLELSVLLDELLIFKGELLDHIEYVLHLNGEECTRLRWIFIRSKRSSSTSSFSSSDMRVPACLILN